MSDDTISPALKPPPAARLGSIDVFRGLVMLLMMAEVLELGKVARVVKTAAWDQLAWHQHHVEWLGCTLHDLIQPSFSFLVGVALPFSIASRRARGQGLPRMTLHAVWRALLLIVLGFFLRSLSQKQTNFTFEDTLTQIGMGYVFLFLLGFRPARDQWIALGLILVGYWAAFAIYPLPGADFKYDNVGVSAAWLKEFGLSGFAAHWQKNSNVAWAFDTWFLNLFPRSKPFTHNVGGYATLSFIPTLATMILGLLAGGVLRREWPAAHKVLWLMAAGAVSMGLALGLQWLGVSPIVKRIWTPGWVLFSGGWCFFILAGFYLIVDVLRLRAWAFPLVVIGMNSIAAYLIADSMRTFFFESWERHVHARFFTMFGDAYKPVVLGGCTLLLYWLILFWMYRRRLFLRI